MSRYQDDLEKLSFSAQQKKDLTRRLLSGEKGTRINMRLPYQGLVAIVAVISLLIGAAGAVSLAGLSPAFRALFGITNQAQEENLGALSLKQVFEDKNGSGASITIKEVVADQEQLYLMMEFTAPEGTVLPAIEQSADGIGYWISGDVKGETGGKVLSLEFFADEACTQKADVYGGYSYGTQYLADDDLTDNRIPLLFTVTTDRGFPSEAQYCRISNIITLGNVQGGGSIEVLAGLNIEVTVPMRSATPAYSFYGRCGVKLGGTTMATVDNLTISPISISFDLIIPDSAVYDEAFAQQGPWPVYVLLQDGTQVAAQFPERGRGRLDQFRADDGTLFFRSDHVTLTLERPIDVGEIKDIVFVGDNDPEKARPGETDRIVHFLFTPHNFYNNTYWDMVNQIWIKTAEATA